MINSDQVKREFKDYNLSESQITEILIFYKSCASTIAALTGSKVAFNSILLKITMNLLKVLIIQILDLAEDIKRRE